MRLVTALLFVLAALCFFYASWYQWQRGRLYRATERRLQVLIARLLAEGAVVERPLPTEWTSDMIDEWEREAKRTGKRPS
jgi:hypothetical protein